MSHSSERLYLQLSRRAAIPALAIVFGLMAVTNQTVQAQTFTVLHAFTDGLDGAYPYAGPTMDKAGNLYGTTMGGVAGTVYKISNKGSGWVLTPLYVFQGGNDGAGPTTRAVIGSDGTLYGAARGGPGGNTNGEVFSLKPQARAPTSVIAPWALSVLYAFTGGSDGSSPGLGDLIFDQAGNIYGTTTGGGAYGWGTAYQLVKSSGGWTFQLLYAFTGGVMAADLSSGRLSTRMATCTARPTRAVPMAMARFSS